MSRVVSLLLGAALLCGHGVFCRRVVSGKSRALPARHADEPGGGPWSARARAVRGSLSRGGGSPGLWEPVPTVGGREEAGVPDCILLCSPPPKTHVKKVLIFFLKVSGSITAKRTQLHHKQHSAFQA